MQLHRWKDAFNAYENVVIAPTQTTSSIQTDAIKKLILLQLILNGELEKLSKFISPGLLRILKKVSPSYSTILQIFDKSNNQPNTSDEVLTFLPSSTTSSSKSSKLCYNQLDEKLRQTLDVLRRERNLFLNDKSQHDDIDIESLLNLAEDSICAKLISSLSLVYKSIKLSEVVDIVNLPLVKSYHQNQDQGQQGQQSQPQSQQEISEPMSISNSNTGLFTLNQNFKIKLIDYISRGLINAKIELNNDNDDGLLTFVEVELNPSEINNLIEQCLKLSFNLRNLIHDFDQHQSLNPTFVKYQINKVEKKKKDDDNTPADEMEAMDMSDVE